MKKKKISKFKIFLLIYVSVLIIGVIFACRWTWNKLAKYQADHDARKAAAFAASQPELVADEFLKTLNYDGFLKYIDEFGLNTEGPFDMKAAHAKYFNDMITANGVKYTKNEQYNDNAPTYDLMAGNTRLAVFSLKNDGQYDEFGYHKWKFNKMAFDTDIIAYHDVTILAPSDCKVSFNGKEFTAEDIIETVPRKEYIESIVTAAGGVIQSSVKYQVKNVLGDVAVKAIDANGNELTAQEAENVYDFSTGLYTERVKEITPRVEEIASAYIMNIYYKKTFSQLAPYLEKNSSAYKVIKDVQDAIAWSWHPAKVDVLEQSVTDGIFYSDSLFACNYYGKIYKFKEGAKENGEEEFHYRMLLKKIDGKWVLSYFVLM